MFRVCTRLFRHRALIAPRSSHIYRARFCSGTSSPAIWRDLFEGRKALENEEKSGLFGVKQLDSPNGFAILTESCLQEISGILREIPGLSGSDLVDSFDRLSNTICKVADLAAYVQHAHPDARFREEASRSSLMLLRLTEELNVNQTLHAFLARLIGSKEAFSALPAQTQRTAQLLMNDFEISGVHLDEKGRQLCVALDQQLQLLKLQILSSFRLPVILKPWALPDVLANFSTVPTTEDGNFIIGYQSDHYHPKVRMKSYLLFFQNNKERAEMVYKLLDCRHKLATAIGYSNYAERALQFSSAGTVERVKEFLSRMSETVRPHAEKELAVLKHVRNLLDGEERYVLPNSATPDRALAYTDLHYVENEMPRLLCPLTSPFEAVDHLTFTVGSVMEGLDQLLQRTFGLRLQPVPVSNGEVWHSSVVKLAMERLDSQSASWSHVGHLYCDFFNRAGKETGDSHYTIRCGFNRPPQPPQSPQTVLSTTSNPDVPLKLATVRTFFHEFGHGLHSMLGQPEYQHISGTRCSNDFAEVPSELMEFFCQHESVLMMIADNKDPEKCRQLASALQARENLFPALGLQEQIAAAQYDLDVHCRSPLCTESVETYFHNAQRQHASVRVPMDCAAHLRLSHIASYGATYYSYPWAYATAALIWNELFARDPFSLEAGCRYRDTILCHGNAVDPSHMLANLLGHTPDIDALVGAVGRELDKANQRLNVIWEQRPESATKTPKKQRPKWVGRKGRTRITEDD